MAKTMARLVSIFISGNGGEELVLDVWPREKINGEVREVRENTGRR